MILLEDKMPMSVTTDGRNTLGWIFFYSETCSIHFLATYHQLSKSIRPNPEFWLEQLWFVGFYWQAAKPLTLWGSS